MNKKTVGIAIDGVIRDFYSQFDKMYRKVYIYNESLVSAEIPEWEEAQEKGVSKNAFVMQEESEDAVEARAKKIEELESELISLPINSDNLLNHYKFEEQVDSFMKYDDDNKLDGEEEIRLTEQEVMHKFINDDYPFQIFGRAQGYGNAAEDFNRLQAFGKREGLFETVLLCKAYGKAIPATYAFLSTHHCRAKKILFVDEQHEKFQHCDILIDANPHALQAVGKGQDAIRIERDWNQYESTEYHFKDLRELNKSEVLRKLCKG